MTTMDQWCRRVADGGISLVQLFCIAPLAESVFHPGLPVAARCVGGGYALALTLTCRKATSVLNAQDTQERRPISR